MSLKIISYEKLRSDFNQSFNLLLAYIYENQCFATSMGLFSNLNSVMHITRVTCNNTIEIWKY